MMPSRFLSHAGALLLPALVLGAGGCGDDGNGPPRSPRLIDIPLDMSLVNAVKGAVAGDTLNILSAPALPLDDALVVNSDQTPLLIRGDKGTPVIASVNQGPIFRFLSPNLGTRISSVGFSGGQPAIQVTGSGELTIEDAAFDKGTVQVLGSGDGLKVAVTRSIMRRASVFSLEMAGNAVLEAENLTIDEAGDCGILFGGGATGRVSNCIIWRSANYGIACDGDNLLDGSGCNDIHMSGTAPYLICTEPDTTSFYEDPLFCDPDNDVYTIEDLSVCAPFNSLGCGLIGAEDPGVCAP